MMENIESIILLVDGQSISHILCGSKAHRGLTNYQLPDTRNGREGTRGKDGKDQRREVEKGAVLA